MIKDIKEEEDWYRIEYSLLSMPSSEICCKCDSETDCFKQEVMGEPLRITNIKTGKSLKADSTLFKKMIEKLKKAEERVYCDRCSMIKLRRDINKALAESYRITKKMEDEKSFHV